MIFSLVSVVVFLIMGMIWSKSDWFNFVIKLGFFALAAWGLIETNAISLNL